MARAASLMRRQRSSTARSKTSSRSPGWGRFLFALRYFANHAADQRGKPGAIGLDTLMGVLGASGNALYCWLVSVSSVTTGGDARTTNLTGASWGTPHFVRI